MAHGSVSAGWLKRFWELRTTKIDHLFWKQVSWFLGKNQNFHFGPFLLQKYMYALLCKNTKPAKIVDIGVEKNFWKKTLSNFRGTLYAPNSNASIFYFLRFFPFFSEKYGFFIYFLRNFPGTFREFRDPKTKFSNSSENVDISRCPVFGTTPRGYFFRSVRKIYIFLYNL